MIRVNRSVKRLDHTQKYILRDDLLKKNEQIKISHTRTQMHSIKWLCSKMITVKNQYEICFYMIIYTLANKKEYSARFLK